MIKSTCKKHNDKLNQTQSNKINTKKNKNVTANNLYTNSICFCLNSIFLYVITHWYCWDPVWKSSLGTHPGNA